MAATNSACAGCARSSNTGSATARAGATPSTTTTPSAITATSRPTATTPTTAGGALQRIPPAPRPAAQRQPLRATAQPAAVRTGQRLGAGLRLQHQQADALPEYRLRAVRYGRSGQFRAGPLLRPAGHASRPPEGPQQRGAHQRVVRREPPGPDRRAFAGHRAALRPPRPRRAQPSDGDRQRSRTLRTALGRGHRARRAGLPVHPARQRLPAIQYRRRPAGRC